MTVAALPHDPLWAPHRKLAWAGRPAGRHRHRPRPPRTSHLAHIPVTDQRLADARRGAQSPRSIQRCRHARPRGWNRHRSIDDLRIADFGDVSEPDGTEGQERAITAVADAASRSQIVVALGGDNSLTVSAALGSWGSRTPAAGLITLDAHYDLRDGVSNGSPVRRLVEEYGLSGQRIVQIGIADFANSREYAQRAMDYGITVVHRDELHRRPMSDVFAEALEIAGAGGGPIHVDLDVDVCDRAVAPDAPASYPAVSPPTNCAPRHVPPGRTRGWSRSTSPRWMRRPTSPTAVPCASPPCASSRSPPASSPARPNP
jgi:formiminoglutamase